jgi:hypothetical protein
LKEALQFFETHKPRERAALVAIITETQESSRATSREHLEELALLADTAGADILFRMTQERPKPDVALYLGKGKVEELKMRVQMEEIELVIFDDELSPVQLRNLEKELDVKILDRSGLIFLPREQERVKLRRRSNLPNSNTCSLASQEPGRTYPNSLAGSVRRAPAKHRSKPIDG